MIKSKSSRAIAWAIAAVACVTAPNVSAEVTNCINITSIPATITTQGVYCLKQHVSAALASGAAITVGVNNVTIDCNDYKIGNLAAGPATSATGILAVGRLNVTVRNCGIRGFRSGVALGNGDYRVEDNRFDQNTQVAIDVSGDGSVVRRNEVIDSGGGTVSGMDWFAGIRGEGDIDVIDNTVSGVVATEGSDADVYGILTTGMDAGTIRGNRVRNLMPDGSGNRRGIWNTGGSHVTVQANTIVLESPLVVGEAAIRCGDALLLNGASRENTVLGTGVLNQALGLVNCTEAGGDFVNPL